MTAIGSYAMLFMVVMNILCTFFIFRDLADFSQLIPGRNISRKAVMRTWYWRHRLAALFAVSAITIVYLHYGYSLGSGTLVWLLLIVSFVLFYLGYVNPGFMMPSQQHVGHFVSVEEAKKKVRPINEVMVMEHDGVARAHPDFEMWRPHIAGNDEGLNGQNIIMTYCSLTNLCMAYVPEIEGMPVDLRVAQQLENNLLMWDRISGEPIQQVWGSKECDGPSGPRMQEYPSFKMPFWAFEKAYPQGQVFVEKRPGFWVSPIRFLHDMIWDMAFYLHIMKQRNNSDFVFPTIKRQDDRLHCKEHVWGVNIGDDYVCYTKSFIEGNELFNTTIGGVDIVIHWDKDYESIAMWYNDSKRPVTSVDFFGNSSNGKLRRVETMKAGAFYGIWYNFFPSTDVNRV